MKISITNHTGARNRGCEALVLSKILGLRKEFSDAEITVHSNDPIYDAWRFEGLAKVCWSYLINTPNHLPQLSLNRLGYSLFRGMEYLIPNVKGINVSTIKTIKEADLVVASGGDIFTSDYANLRKHLAYPLLSNRSSLYLCSQSIGPFKGKDEEYFLRAADGIGAISAREKETYDYLKSIDVQADIHLTADVAFTLPFMGRDETLLKLNKFYGIRNTENLVALSISQGIIKYSGLDKESYYATFAGLCDKLIESGKSVILIPHVMEKNPNNNDVVACDEVVRRITHNIYIPVLRGEPSATFLKGVIGCCDCLIGTRTHATIAAMSQGIPTVSIAYSRKAYGIMRDVYGETIGDSLTVNARDINVSALLNAYEIATSTSINDKHLSTIKERAEKNFSIAAQMLS